jgi:hypothetical protein
LRSWRDRPVEDSGVVFTEEETRALLASVDRNDAAWERIRQHLQALGQAHQEPVIGRNLHALLAARRSSALPSRG